MGAGVVGTVGTCVGSADGGLAIVADPCTVTDALATAGGAVVAA